MLIAAAFRDFALVMTDAEILALRENLAVAVSAQPIARDIIAADLGRYAPALAPNLLSQLKRLSFASATHVAAAIAPEARPSVHVRVGLAAAGFDVHGAFVAGALHEDGMGKPDAMVARAIEGTAFVVIGGDNAGAKAHFAEGLSAIGIDASTPVSAFLDAGMATMRFAAAQGEPFGGRVEYRIMRKRQPAESGFLEGSESAS